MLQDAFGTQWLDIIASVPNNSMMFVLTNLREAGVKENKHQKYKPSHQDVTAGACLLSPPLHRVQDASECLHSINHYLWPQFSWVAMSSLLPLHQLATRPWGQRGQKWQARLCTACEYGRNTFPGDCFSITAQLYSIAREIHNMGSAVGASSNLCLVACSYHTAGAQNLIIIRQQGESIFQIRSGIIQVGRESY